LMFVWFVFDGLRRGIAERSIKKSNDRNRVPRRSEKRAADWFATDAQSDPGQISSFLSEFGSSPMSNSSTDLMHPMVRSSKLDESNELRTPGASAMSATSKNLSAFVYTAPILTELAKTQSQLAREKRQIAKQRMFQHRSKINAVISASMQLILFISLVLFLYRYGPDHMKDVSYQTNPYIDFAKSWFQAPSFNEALIKNGYTVMWALKAVISYLYDVYHALYVVISVLPLIGAHCRVARMNAAGIQPWTMADDYADDETDDNDDEDNSNRSSRDQ